MRNDSVDEDTRYAIVEDAVEALMPYAVNRTQAWNMWNNINGDKRWQRAMVLIHGDGQFPESEPVDVLIKPIEDQRPVVLDEECPNCDAPLRAKGITEGGGVVCSKECGYWDCY